MTIASPSAPVDVLGTNAHSIRQTSQHLDSRVEHETIFVTLGLVVLDEIRGPGLDRVRHAVGGSGTFSKGHKQP